MGAYVVDTNVAVVANGRAGQAGPPCVSACVSALLEVCRNGTLVLDEGGRILDEYLRHLSPSGQPGVGDEFMKWVWQNQANSSHCERVVIHPSDDDETTFEEFPDDPDLQGFDRSDRKFVAVALASRNDPCVLNAVDSDWWDARVALKRRGVNVRFLCPEQFT